MSQVDVSQDYGAMLIGGLLAFRYVATIDRKKCGNPFPRSLSGCVNMQFIMYWRLYPGEPYHTKSLVVNSSNRLLHILIALHRSLQRGTCVSFGMRDGCQWNSGFLTCAIPHFWPLPSGIPSLCHMVISINWTIFLGTQGLIISYEPYD
jgi:hypothetical protein